MTAASTATLPSLIRRRFTAEGEDPYDQVEWEERTATIGDKFRQEGVEFPKSWSQNATNIVAEKYFAKGMGERSVRQMIDRVAGRIAEEGIKGGYFAGIYEGQPVGTPGTENHEATIFYNELKHILLNQLAAFNSPVWFNVGVEGRKQQCSACFILSIKDSMQSILHWYQQEGMIFKGGSGSGINISNLRGSKENLSTGGIASGPVSFMRAADANAGTIKSGGMTRRAAKMVILDDDHPDIFDFVTCKSREEERLFKLIAGGIPIGFEGEGERNLAEVTSFQNANNSVRVSDKFMRLATGHRNGPDWDLIGRNTGKATERVRAADLLDEIAKAAWRCGDPGLQFDSTIQKWHTTPAQGKIKGSNPCAEYLSNDDSSCNLASINLLKFLRPDGSYDLEGYKHTVDIMTTAMDILVEFAYYPGDEEGELLGERTRKMRQLGLGYANLGALLMAQGIAYESEDGRDIAGAIASLTTARAYHQSALLAQKLGPFHDYEANAETMKRVLYDHQQAAGSLADLTRQDGPAERLASSAFEQWLDTNDLGCVVGWRNAQATVMAPTGTISFLLDCITTGVEPSLALWTYKTLAGGGSLEIVNPLVPTALYALGVDSSPASDAFKALESGGEAEFFKTLDPRYHPVFATAIGHNQVSHEGHIRMLGAIQPHISGGISKTVNMPEDTTWEQIRDAYVLAWREGVKCIAIYRDNSKATQVLHTSPQTFKEEAAEEVGPPEPVRKRLPQTRDAKVHKFNLGMSKGFLTVGMYPDGTVGEVFVSGFGQEGSTVSGLAGAWAKAVSIMLQYGVPVEEVVESFAHMRFEPEGFTGNPDLPKGDSIPDYVVRYLATLNDENERWEDDGGPAAPEDINLDAVVLGDLPGPQLKVPTGKTCSRCGGVMQRTGSCYTCQTCGDNTGCG